jgi:hypothetical protein
MSVIIDNGMTEKAFKLAAVKIQFDLQQKLYSGFSIAQPGPVVITL